MHIQRLLIFIAIVYSVLLSPLIGVSSQKLPVQSIRKVTVAVLPDFPPTYYRDAVTGEPKGFAIDIMNEAAHSAGLEVKYIFGQSWTELQEMIETGKADIIPILTINEERMKRLAFTKPVETLPISYIVSKGKNVSGPMPGMRVGVMQGASTQVYLAQRKDITLVPEQSLQGLLIDLLSGKIDMIMSASPNIVKIAIEAGIDDKITVLEPPVYVATRGMALRINDVELRNRLDKAIEKPGIDGLEAYENILKLNPAQKAIIVSGFSESEEAQRIGAGAYVPKPYVLERLGMAVRKELDRT
jgi:ABC-type amino acid transport substrate-binding protein